MRKRDEIISQHYYGIEQYTIFEYIKTNILNISSLIKIKCRNVETLGRTNSMKKRGRFLIYQK